LNRVTALKASGVALVGRASWNGCCAGGSSIRNSGGFGDCVCSGNWLSISNSNRGHSDRLSVSDSAGSSRSGDRSCICNWDSNSGGHRAGANDSLCNSCSNGVSSSRRGDSGNYSASVGNRRCSDSLVSRGCLNRGDCISGSLRNSCAGSGCWWVASGNGGSKDSGSKNKDGATEHLEELQLGQH